MNFGHDCFQIAPKFMPTTIKMLRLQVTTIKVVVFGVLTTTVTIPVELNFVMNATIPWIHIPTVVSIKSYLSIFHGYLFPLPEEKEESDPKPVANIFLMLYLSLPKESILSIFFMCKRFLVS